MTHDPENKEHPMPYSAEITEKAEDAPALGAEYFEAGKAAERFLAHWDESHAEQLAKDVIKPVLDIVQEKVWDAFRDWLLHDAEYNVQSYMRDMVEKSVRALIGGHKWANVKYITPGGNDGPEIREALAKIHGDEIKDARIADLEKEVVRLRNELKFHRDRW